MNLNQVHALAVAALLVASVLTALWGTEIAGGLGGAWARGTAQAAAEKRRLAAAAAEARDSGTWKQAKAAGRGMRGAAKGAGAWARKENGPLRRVAAATAAGAYIGARRAARAAAGAVRRRTAGSAPTTGSRFRPRRHLGVCDGCGVTVARASLKGNRCVRCRPRESRQYGTPPPQAPLTAPPGAGARPGSGPGPRPAPAAVPGPVPPAAPVPAGAAPVPGGQLPSGGDGAAAGTVPGGQLPPRLPSPVQATSGQAPAAIQSPDAGGTLMPPGIPAIGYRRPGSAVAVRPGGTGTAVAARPHSAVATGDATTHGEWVRNVVVVVESLSRLFKLAKQMTDEMTAKDGSDSLIADTDRWADRISVHGRKILSDLLEIDGNLAPYINAVMDAGGPSEVASPEWHAQY